MIEFCGIPRYLVLTCTIEPCGKCAGQWYDRAPPGSADMIEKQELDTKWTGHISKV